MDMSRLTPEQLAQYDELGYVVLENLLDSATLATLRAVTEEVERSAAGVSDHTNVLDLEASHTPENPRLRRIKSPHAVHPFFRELAAYRPLMEALEPLIGSNIRMRPGGKINMKSASYGSPVEWHQDWAFYPHTNQDVLAAGILLDDMTADNGPVRFLPGSHKGPIYDHHANGAFCGAINLSVDGPKIEDAVEIYATAGSVTLHHARLVHGSALNKSEHQRRVLYFEYAATDAWPLGGIEHVANMDEFNSRIVHGQPTLQPRMEDVPVRMPLPTAKYVGSIYENQRTLESRYFDRASETEQTARVR